MHYNRRSRDHVQRQRDRGPAKIRSRSRYSTSMSNLPPIKRISSPNHRIAHSARQLKKRQFMQRRRKAEARKAFHEEKAALQKQLTMIAVETERIVRGTGQYIEDNVIPTSHTEHPSYRIGEPSLSSFSQVVHDISPQIELSRQLTTFYPHYSDSLANWRSSPPQLGSFNTIIEFTSSSTLKAARHMSLHDPHLVTSASSSNLPLTKLGVLSFASPKKPRGGSSHGGEEQMDSIIRSSSLVTNLLDSSAGEMFYAEHKKYWREDGSGLHDHGMLYAPGVVVFRKDDDEEGKQAEDEQSDHVVSMSSDVADADAIPRRQASGKSTRHFGVFISPYNVNVLSAVPVNAGAVRSKHVILPEDKQLFEDGIRSAMKERMARILRVFEERGDRSIVLGAFGCGCSSQNAVDMVASIWAELLVCGDRDESSTERRKMARFGDVFDKVVFAVPGKLFHPFKEAFEMRVFEEEVSSAAMDD
jgi:hypothetical protein